MSKNIPTNSASLKLPDYSGAWWSFKHTHTTTMRFGKFTPIKTIEVPGGSMYKCKPSIRFESLPMVSPLYNGYTLQLKYFFVPYRLYVPKLRKNRHLEWNAIPKLPLPSLVISSTLGNSITSIDDPSLGTSISLAGSLLERLKLAYGEFVFGQSFHLPVPAGIEERNEYRSRFIMPNIAPLVAYVDAWLNTEFNPQDRLIPVDVDRFSPSNRVYERRFIPYDTLRQFVDLYSFGDADGSSAVMDAIEYDKQSHRLTLSSPSSAHNGVSFGQWPLTSFFTAGTGSTLKAQYLALTELWPSLQNTVSAVGLLPVTYRGDYFSSWFAEDVINSLEQYVVNSGESLISLRRKNSEMLLNLIGNISGQKWRDYVEFVYHENLEFADHPILLGSDTYDFGTIDFIANAEIVDSSQANPGSTSVVGGAASKAREYNRQFDMFKVKSKEPGFVMVTASIVPSVVYYQGIPRHLRSREIDDLWHPNYQKMGFQQTLYGELFSVGVTPSIAVDGIQLLDEDQNTVSGVSFSDRDQLGLGYVPLGWEFMKRYNDLSGGLLTTTYTTWVNRRDVLRTSSLLREGVVPGADVTQSVFNPLFNPNEDLLLSTYVDSMLFNDSFANNSRAEAENIIVKFAFDESIYQPVVHQLIDKRI